MKDKEGNVKGPYMSFDMDVWNEKKDFFEEDVLISISNEKFMPLQKYINRDH